MEQMKRQRQNIADGKKKKKKLTVDLYRLVIIEYPISFLLQ